MEGDDPLGGRNPFALARIVRSGNAPCPVCGRKCSVEASVRNEELIVSALCGECGKTHPLRPSVGEDGDLHLFSGDSEYLPTWAEHREPAGDEKGNCGIEETIIPELVRTGRRYAAVQRGKALAERYASHIGGDGWPDAVRLCLEQVAETAFTMIEAGSVSDGIALFEKYLPVADSDSTSVRINFHNSLALAHLSDGNIADSVKDIRSLTEELAAAKKDGTVPGGDPLVAARTDETLGTLLTAKRDWKGAMRAYRAAVDECLSMEPADDVLRFMCRVSEEFASAASQGQAEKKGTEAVKNAVKVCQSRKDDFPGAYAESLLQRARYLNSINAKDPRMRDSMDEAISILSDPDEHGRYAPQLILAYYYRSASSTSRDSLDVEDLGRAYSILRDNLISGSLPEGVMGAVSAVYVQYLDLFDPERSAAVRRELAGLGFVFPAPPEVKSEKRSE